MRVGVIGAGQLGMMLGQAAESLGIECLFLDPAESPPAARAGKCVRAEFDDQDALRSLARDVDVLTYEFENVPVDALARLDGIDIYPPLAALSAAQDRLSEKQLFERLGIQLPGYHAIDSREDLALAIDTLGLPLVLKTRRFGYDGKGQALIRDAAAADDAFLQLGGSGLIAEAWVDFDFEVSAIAARSRSGELSVYPLTRNTHRGGILHTSIAPVLDSGLDELARDYIQRLLEHLDYVGTLALELFVCGDQLLANEFAPRVHNSGHWTIEGCAASQFENHMRAVAGLPLAEPGCGVHAGMINLIGSMPAGIVDAGGTLHDYGKAERPGRKLGHVTITSNTEAARDRALQEIGEFVTRSTSPAVRRT